MKGIGVQTYLEQELRNAIPPWDTGEKELLDYQVHPL